MSPKGKVAIVTGGNSGIGMTIVLALAKQGANIVIDYVAHPEATEALEKQVVALGDQAIGVKADAGKIADLQPGDIIRDINRKPIRNLSDYGKATEGVAKEKSVLFLIQREDNTIFLALRRDK